jgi:hypothetical protein
MVEDEETGTMLYTASSISARHCLPLRPEQERNCTTIIPFLNRRNLADHG